ncbi:MAG: CCA tRNA nucleotidyltransferase [Chloroflexi bacterium]|nr:CCA tRNA nucleotidyltransferase [Chloroflexota bacterium]MBT7081381.1 CCA tRNA nucleotidyltransferase [Chloroflexota bacterium]MBT7290334.1 CCA tRNA nucleotidyltransferase [Chloroflexota bacterium]
MTNISINIKESLSEELLNLLKACARAAQEHEYDICIVGGVVRDILLERPVKDIDLSVDGDAIALARYLGKATDGKVKTHPRFGTANYTKDNISIDFASSRSETYAKPGALPQVDKGSIKEDLARRDFSINAMAISLNDSNFGELIDNHNGLADLKAGLIRVLHRASFADDATRIFRAIRYEQRLGFSIEPDTEDLIKRNIAMLNTISPDRLRNELELILLEEHPAKALGRADELGVLRQLHPSLKVDAWLKSKLDEAKTQNLNNGIQIQMALLTYNLDEQELKALLKCLNISGKRVHIIKEVHGIKKELLQLLDPELAASRIYRTLNKFSSTAISTVYIAEESVTIRKHLDLYTDKLQDVHPILDGESLKKMGITTGRKMGQILTSLLDAKLDQKMQTIGDEEKMVRQMLRGDKQ